MTAGPHAPSLCALACLVALVAIPAGSSADSAGARFNAEIVWADSTHGIFAANPDGSNVRQLISEREVLPPDTIDEFLSPAWSPSGDRLVFTWRISDSTGLYMLGPATRARRVDLRSRWTMPRRSAFSFLLESTWAPDGQHLAVSDGWDLVHSTIRVVSLGQGRLLRPLARPSHRRADFSPAWSPGGRTIAFVRQRVRRGAVTGPPVILLVAPDGTSLRRLTRGAAPSWSPNGRHLVYARGSGIYRIEADGDARTRIAGGLNGYGGYLQPQWSPDGRKILYVTKDGIWAMNVDGSDHVRVVRLSYPGGAGWRPG